MSASGKRWMVFGLVVLAVVLISPMVFECFRPRIPGQSPEVQLSAERIKFMAPDRVLQAMNLRPGLTVLDIGAGTGLFTFRLAQAVGDAGRVFATDTGSSVLRYLRRQSRRANITNVELVLVREKGLDPFYTQNTFDVILASEVMPLIAEPGVFFQQLRPSLKAGGGRLWIVTLRLDSDFDADEFGDFRAVLDFLRSEGASSLLAGRLSPRVREALAAERGASVSEPLRTLLVEDFNRILNAPALWPELQRWLASHPSFLNAREAQLRQHLGNELAKAGVFAPGARDLDDGARPMLRLLNRLIIQDAFKTKVWERAFSLDNLGWWQRGPLLSWRERTPSLLKTAGYELVCEHKLLLYHRVWEFKRAQ